MTDLITDLMALLSKYKKVYFLSYQFIISFTITINKHNVFVRLISYPGITQFSLYASTVFPIISSALSKIVFKVCPVLAIEFKAGPPYYVWVAIPTQE